MNYRLHVPGCVQCFSKMNKLVLFRVVNLQSQFVLAHRCWTQVFDCVPFHVQQVHTSRWRRACQERNVSTKDWMEAMEANRNDMKDNKADTEDRRAVERDVYHHSNEPGNRWTHEEGE